MITPREALARAGERLEAGTVILVLLVAGALWAFLAIAGEVREGETAAFDRWLLLALRDPADPANPLGPLWLREVGRDLTALGGVAVLTLLTVAVAAWLALRRLWGATWLLLASVGGGILVSTLLKLAFERARPDLVPH